MSVYTLSREKALRLGAAIDSTIEKVEASQDCLRLYVEFGDKAYLEALGLGLMKVQATLATLTV
jgi:hypothetical protein